MRVGTSICDSALRTQQQRDRQLEVGMNGVSTRQTFAGRWVKTIVLTSPMRLAMRTRPGQEKRREQPVQKKIAPAVASDRSKRSKSQSASSDWTTKPPPKASRLNSAASL